MYVFELVISTINADMRDDIVYFSIGAMNLLSVVFGQPHQSVGPLGVVEGCKGGWRARWVFSNFKAIPDSPRETPLSLRVNLVPYFMKCL